MARAVYKASDDSEHATEKKAAYRDALIEANKRLEAACKDVSTLLVGAALTADGKPFNTSRSAEYWVVHRVHGRMPWFRNVVIYPYNVSVDFDRNDNALVLREYDYDRKEYIHWNVNELYTEETAARAAMIKACEEWVKEQVEMIEQMKTERRR